MTLRNTIAQLSEYPKTPQMPVLFVGHGSPMNGVEDNIYTRAWKKLGASLSIPRAIVVISAHWLSERVEVDISPTPETIYDFYGFPDALYRLKYEAKGEPFLAEKIAEGLLPEHQALRTVRGLDHGAWIVLRRMYEKSNIPVFQIAIDFTKPAQFHFDLGRALAPLRERGVLILGSGNIVHNLRMMNVTPGAKALDWAIEFDEKVKIAVQTENTGALIDHTRLGRSAQLAVPMTDHYLPLLYTLGASEGASDITFPTEGIDGGSVSMRSVLFS